jgi:hypothetical protein
MKIYSMPFWTLALQWAFRNPTHGLKDVTSQNADTSELEWTASDAANASVCDEFRLNGGGGAGPRHGRWRWFSVKSVRTFKKGLVLESVKEPSARLAKQPALSSGFLLNLIFAIFLFLSTGCELPPPSTAYQPPTPQADLVRLTPSQARDQLQRALETTVNTKTVSVDHDGFQVVYAAKTSPLFIDTVGTVGYGGDGSFRLQGGETFSFRFNAINNVALLNAGLSDDNFVLGLFGDCDHYKGYVIKGIQVAWKEAQVADARAAADALNILVFKSTGSDVAQLASKFEEFKGRAATWRTLANKPPLPEETRKYLVLAQNAVQENNFQKAGAYYEQGLEIEPLWPDAQFNAAVIDSKLNEYAEAAYHMRCYLELLKLPEITSSSGTRKRKMVNESKILDPCVRVLLHRWIVLLFVCRPCTNSREVLLSMPFVWPGHWLVY